MRRTLTFVAGRDYATVRCPVCGGHGTEPETSTVVQWRCYFCLGRGTVRALPNIEQLKDTSS